MVSEGSVATTRKAMTQKFGRDAPVPDRDGSGNAFAVVEPVADRVWALR